MARTGRPKAELILSSEERTALEGWVRRRSTPQAWALRCRIILACAEGASNKDVAARLGSTPHAVGRWRARFVEHRIAGLGDMPRPGGPRTVTDEQVAALVTRTLEAAPKNATHWSTRSMAKELGLSQSTVSRVWRAFGLQPHRSESFKLSTDPYFVDKVHDVVGLYLDPPERALVFCVDEKSQIQALDRSQPVLPMMPGVPQRVTHDYVRAGTTTLFAALEVATGKVIGSLHRRHRAEEFKKFLIKLDKEVPDGLAVHLVLDNYATHKTPAIKTWLLAHPRFHLHFTPTGSSWLNLVERWFAELTNKRIRRGVHKTVQALEQDIRTWIAAWNTDPRPYVWTKTANEILERLASYLNRIPDSED
ncbi:IS630 family transposase [Streptomyces vietnamensis]|uniref:Endonuclease DDE n=1 Tax=Streptomyces vietnamensis TaxID=362257 RepID=A0A0B5I0M5_9ACTN|nr:IS630 family transposase [Streptomyces vietnamensis]AJF63173.1 endonuclease DDE [Streptomyces vietnamensis]AJF69361.1 endonuclease DDE [Streptomyces vietnamensis]AJF69387.1 endonuclease DDE [Streptomyces vietnamensis]